jgi:predicted  nucleic acid-binding Zn-ribbon protein
MSTSATADNLRELHQLHQRARALRDRLASGPKTLAAREAALANRQAALETSRKALQEARVQLKKNEHSVQGWNTKIDDLKLKQSLAKKNDEYKAIQNQIAIDKNAIEKLEVEMLEEMERIDELVKKLASDEADAKKFAADVATLKAEIASQSDGQRQQLNELETAIVEAESIIPEDLRERYRRTVKQHGADAMAPVEYDRKHEMASCTGCFVALTTQALNELINGDHISFCKSCGRVLYLPEEDQQTTRRGG